MDFIPYSCQSITPEDIEAVTAVLRSEYITQGPVLPQFESAFARLHDAPHAVGVANATAALHLACIALGAGPGAPVWTSPNSFVASANCGLYCSAPVDFVDIDPATRNLSVAALREKLRNEAPRGRLPRVLVPVDFAGLPCDLREMRALADEYGFRILEDASHATGARYLGEPVGSRYAHATVFSFHAVKIVTTAEGGLITTGDTSVAQTLRLLRSHGTTREEALMERPADGAWYYEQQTLGYNYRMTEMQAALGLSQLQRLGEMHRRRVGLADRYDGLLAELPVIRPPRLPDRESAWHLYVVEIDGTDGAARRKTAFQRLREAGIGVNVHYIPIHTHPYYQRLGFARGNFPSAERYYDRAISLPLFPRMTEAQQDRVVSALRAALVA